MTAKGKQYQAKIQPGKTAASLDLTDDGVLYLAHLSRRLTR